MNIKIVGKNIELGEFNIDLKASLDNSVLVYGAEGNANFTSIDLEVEVESKLSEEDFIEFVSEVERRCPLTQLYVRSGVNVRNNWTNKPLTWSIWSGVFAKNDLLAKINTVTKESKKI